MNTLTIEESSMLNRYYRTGGHLPTRGPAPAFKRQIESKSSSYHSFKAGGIWRDRVTKSDRSCLASATPGKRDCFGNLFRTGNVECMVRAQIQRAAVHDKELGKVLRNMSPKEYNALIDGLVSKHQLASAE